MPRRIPATRRDGWNLEQYNAEADKVIRAANRRRAKEALEVERVLQVQASRRQADALRIEVATREETVAAMCDGNRANAHAIYEQGLWAAACIDDGQPRDHQAALSAAVVKLDQLGGQE